MKKVIPILGAAIAVAAVCLIIFQLYWIREARRTKETEFNAAVNTALDQLVLDLEKREVVWQMKFPGGGMVNSKSGISSQHVEHIELNVNTDSISQQIVPINDKTLESQLSELMQHIDKRQLKPVDVLVEASKFGQKVKNKKVLVDNIVEKIISVEVPLEQRISQPMLDSLIRSLLRQHSIGSTFRFVVYNEKSKQVFFGNTDQRLFAERSPDIYMRQIFPNDVLLDPHTLYVTFPYKWSYISGSIGTTLYLSLGLIALVIGVFVATFLSLVREKRLTQMRSDFVSNMTHELKTPIASITLASELLHDPTVPAASKSYERMADIIYSQVKRLSQLVERTLQNSMFEHGHAKLDRKFCNAHTLIGNAIDASAFSIASKQATIARALNAERSTIWADEIHFTNIIVNLLDNALKYSGEHPHIEVRTANSNGGLLVQVADNGIGIPKDDSKRIFEQFYRVHTGNVHNVKGFGLGLNYVRNVVRAHKGKIWVESTLGKGSTFNVWMAVVGD